MIVHESVKSVWLIILNQPMAVTSRIISGTQNKENFKRDISQLFKIFRTVKCRVTYPLNHGSIKILHKVKYGILTLRLLMSYIYGAPILDVSRSYTTTHHSR